MSVHYAYSTKPDPFVAAEDLKNSLSGIEPVMILFFASSYYRPEPISEAMQNAFPGATVIGCSTAGEIVSGHMLKNSVVAMAFDKGTIKQVSVDTIPLGDPQEVEPVLKRLAGSFGKEPLTLDPSRYVGLIIFDGLSGAEEVTMERIGDMTNIQVIGGSAGDDLAFSRTQVYLNGRSYSNAAVLAILEPHKQFDLIKTQSFSCYGKKLTPTKTDPVKRRVLEFNGRPAASAYGEAIGVTANKVAEMFMKHPVGLMADDEPFVRSPQKTEGEGIDFYCQVHEGVELDVLVSGDIISDTKKAIDEKDPSKIEALINFNCILRTLQLEHEGKTKDYGEIFSGIPTIGFSTYGEEYIGHMNQTATMLVFLNQ